MHLIRIAHLAVWERPGAGPPLLFTHATGFHGRLWDRIIEGLPDRHCFAIDLRGHGRSDKDLPSYDWRRFGEDTALVAQELSLHDAIGVGHSLGGYAMALAAAIEPAAFQKLLLLDPVIQMPDRYDGHAKAVDFIARRRLRWNSPEEMFDRFRTRLPFSNWQPDILRDYCQYGLLPEGDEFILACPPKIEATIYERSNWPDADISAELATIETPATIVRSAKLMTREHFDLSASATDPNLSQRMPNARDVYLPHCTHFIPMEHPELVIDALK